MSKGPERRVTPRVWATAAIAALLAAACSSATPTPTPVSPPLVLLASREAYASAQSLRRGYIAASRTRVAVEVRLASKGDVASQLGDHAAEFALVLGEPEPGWWAAPLGSLPLEVVVNSTNPSGEIRQEDLRGLFVGSIVNWRTLGGSETAVTIVTQDPQSEASQVFARSLVGGAALGGWAWVAPTGWAVAQAVGQEAGAIGYLACPEMTSRIRAVTILDGDTGNPVHAALELFALATEAPQGEAVDFLLWAQSPDGRRAVSGLCAEG